MRSIPRCTASMLPEKQTVLWGTPLQYGRHIRAKAHPGRARLHCRPGLQSEAEQKGGCQKQPGSGHAPAIPLQLAGGPLT